MEAASLGFRSSRERREPLPPERILRVWLIAGSRWQRFAGEMSIKKLNWPRSRHHRCDLAIETHRACGVPRWCAGHDGIDVATSTS